MGERFRTCLVGRRRSDSEDAPAVPGRSLHGPGSAWPCVVQAGRAESTVLTSIRAAAQTFPREAETTAGFGSVGLDADEPRAASHRQAWEVGRLQRNAFRVRHAVVR